MFEFSLKDTAAYKIVDQLVSHTYSGTEWAEKDLAAVYRLYSQRGGSWEGLILGDPQEFVNLEKAVGDYINYRDILNVAKGLCSD